MAGLTAHIIHRPARTDRKARFLGWNGAHAVAWQWHDAVEAELVDRTDSKILSAPVLDIASVAVATALSHRRQWQDCVASGQPRLIAEDDACFRHGCEPWLANGMTALAAADIIFFGCNTDAATVLALPDRLFVHVAFGNGAQAEPGYFDRYARQAPPSPPPTLYQTYLIWGLLAYAVSPAGAAKLLELCFPLRPVSVDLLENGRKLESCAVDAQINAALQQGSLRALASFPPVVIGPNADSDLDGRKRPRGRG